MLDLCAIPLGAVSEPQRNATNAKVRAAGEVPGEVPERCQPPVLQLQ